MRKNPARRGGRHSTMSPTGNMPADQDQGLEIDVGATTMINTEWRGSTGRWASPRQTQGIAYTPGGHGVMRTGFLSRRQMMLATPGSRYLALGKVWAALPRPGSEWIRHRSTRLRMDCTRKAGRADRALGMLRNNRAWAHKDSLKTVAPWRRTTSSRRAAAVQ